MSQREPVHVAVVRQRVAGVVIRYYWLLTLLSLLAYLYGGGRRHIELSYYPLYFAIGWLVKAFLYRRVPAIVVDLRQSGALPGEAVPRAASELESRLNHPVASHVFGAIGGLAIVLFYLTPLASLLTIPWSLMIIIAIDVLLGYAAGVASWKAIAVARHVGTWSRRGELTVRPLHPDGAGGLEAVGRLFFSLSLIFMVGGLFCSGWIAYARWLSSSGPPAGYEDLEPGLVGGIAALVLLSVFAFVKPMISLHHRMSEEARPVEARWARMGLTIADLADSLLARHGDLTESDLKEQSGTLQALRTVYAQRRHVATWPVNLQTIAKFITIQIPLWISLASSANTLVELVQKFGAQLLGR